MKQGRIAKEIAIIRELDELGKANYRSAITEGMGKYSGRYDAVNQRMLDVLGVEIVGDLLKYPSQLKIVEASPSVRGVTWDNKVWVKDDLPYKEKVINHELAHIGFGHSQSDLPIALQEVQAEGTSYGIGHRLGIPLDVLAMSSAPVLNSRMRQYSPEQIGNMLEMNRSRISEMVNKFMRG